MTMTNMNKPPVDHGSDRYDYVEVDAPPSVIPSGPWFTELLDQPCETCRANMFLRYLGGETAQRESWYVTFAHDDHCPQVRTN
jgi:hypothetical protein